MATPSNCTQSDRLTLSQPSTSLSLSHIPFTSRRLILLLLTILSLFLLPHSVCGDQDHDDDDSNTSMVTFRSRRTLTLDEWKELDRQFQSDVGEILQFQRPTTTQAPRMRFVNYVQPLATDTTMLINVAFFPCAEDYCHHHTTGAHAYEEFIQLFNKAGSDAGKDLNPPVVYDPVKSAQLWNLTVMGDVDPTFELIRTDYVDCLGSSCTEVVHVTSQLVAQLVVILVVVVVISIFCACVIIGGGAFVDRKRARARELASAGGNGIPHTDMAGSEDATDAIDLEIDDADEDERDGSRNGKVEFNSVHHSPVPHDDTEAIELAEPSQTSRVNKEKHILSNLADTLDDGVEDDDEV